MKKISATDLHEAADELPAAGRDTGPFDESQEYLNLEPDALHEFIDASSWGPPEGGDVELDDLSLAIGISIGILAERNRRSSGDRIPPSDPEALERKVIP